MNAYRRPPDPPPEAREPGLDPWYLALLFAWVAVAWRIGIGIVNRRPVFLEVAFAALLGVTTLTVGVHWMSVRRRRARRVAAAAARPRGKHPGADRLAR